MSSDLLFRFVKNVRRCSRNCGGKKSLEQEYQIKDYFALNEEKNRKRVQQKNGEAKLNHHEVTKDHGPVVQRADYAFQWPNSHPAVVLTKRIVLSTV